MFNSESPKSIVFSLSFPFLYAKDSPVITHMIGFPFICACNFYRIIVINSNHF